MTLIVNRCHNRTSVELTRTQVKLGFKRAIVPKGQTFPQIGLEIVPVAKALDAIVAAIPA
ncbi:MAG: hypothetical protein KME17_04305 [Cyanosarcina radialis HA8281-LM2]|nr:hypothetical protein [Cyanosarcina radialis HA8281-LM2]